ncbi:MAG: helix-hairpin-helix domain-containing protein [Microgenomates group bacterium]|nr:helix-hairpin-helix domain-containing protein [Microgenomates group bacterium]
MERICSLGQNLVEPPKENDEQVKPDNNALGLVLQIVSIVATRINFLRSKGLDGPPITGIKPLSGVFSPVELDKIRVQRTPGQTPEEWLAAAQPTIGRLARILKVSPSRARALLEGVGADWPFFERPFRLKEKTKELLQKYGFPDREEELTTYIISNQLRPDKLCRMLHLPRQRKALVYYLYRRLGIPFSDFPKDEVSIKEKTPPEVKRGKAKTKLEGYFGKDYLDTIIKQIFFNNLSLRDIAHKKGINPDTLRDWLEKTREISQLGRVGVFKWVIGKYPDLSLSLSPKQEFIFDLLKKGLVTNISELLEKYQEKFGRVTRQRILQHLQSIKTKILKAININKSWGAVELGVVDPFSGLPIRARNALLRGGITTIDELKALTPQQLRRIRGIGNKTLQDIKDWLNDHGLNLARAIEGTLSLTLQTKFNYQKFILWQEDLKREAKWSDFKLRPRLSNRLYRLKISPAEVATLSDDELITKGLKPTQINELRRKLFEKNIISSQSAEWGEIRLIAGARISNRFLRDNKKTTLEFLLSCNDSELRNLGIKPHQIDKIKEQLQKIRDQVNDWENSKNT